MASIVVEQNGPANNKVLIDQVADMDSNFDEVIILLNLVHNAYTCMHVS